MKQYLTLVGWYMMRWLVHDATWRNQRILKSDHSFAARVLIEQNWELNLLERFSALLLKACDSSKHDQVDLKAYRSRLKERASSEALTDTEFSVACSDKEEQSNIGAPATEESISNSVASKTAATGNAFEHIT
jgi:hypothetical protein